MTLTPDDHNRIDKFARASRAALDAKGLSQVEVADRLGWPSSTLNGMMRGHTGPNPRQAIAIEEAIGVDPGHLTIHLGYLPPAAREVEILDPEGAIIADDTLSGEHKTIILGMIKALRGGQT